jgi:hypothetical protein
MFMRYVLLVVLLLCTSIGAAPQAPSRAFIGTWKLVSRVDRDRSGKTIPEPSLGSNPIGYLVYDSTGHVFVQIMALNRSADPCAVSAPSQANNLASFGGYDAYFGRYEIDPAAGKVTHILEGALSQADVGRRLTRSYRLEGDSLTLEFDPAGQGQTIRTLVWRRMTM